MGNVIEQAKRQKKFDEKGRNPSWGDPPQD